MSDKCNQCGKESGGSYASCHPIQNDYPQVMEIENSAWKMIVEGAFQFAHKTRCEFMHWLMTHKGITADVEGLYTLPEGIEMRPAAMIELEEEILRLAKIEKPDRKGELKFLQAISQYKERVKAFFENQYQLLADPVSAE